MGALSEWAKGWVTRLVEQGGAHGQGSSLSIAIDSEGFSYLQPSELDERRAENHTPAPDGRRRKSGRRAVTYESSWQSEPALWIDAVQYADGRPDHHVVLAMPFRRTWLGRVKAAGTVQVITTNGDKA